MRLNFLRGYAAGGQALIPVFDPVSSTGEMVRQLLLSEAGWIKDNSRGGSVGMDKAVTLILRLSVLSSAEGAVRETSKRQTAHNLRTGKSGEGLVLF